MQKKNKYGIYEIAIMKIMPSVHNCGKIPGANFMSP